MQERVTTSFIPKASLQVERETRSTRRGSSLVSILAGVIFLLAAMASVGMFLFERYTIQSIEAKGATLERSRAAFEPSTIEQLSRLDTRLGTAEKLLSNHPALSNLFDELEEKTLTSIRFNDFFYDVGAQNGAALSFSGDAASFNAVALQSDAFSKSSLISDPIFSDVNIAPLGVVRFNFKASVHDTALHYVPLGAAPSEPPPPEESATPIP